MSHLQILPGTGNRGPHSKERYFLEIRNRNKWLLEMGGERVLLYKRKYTGTRCSNFDQVRKTNQQHGQDEICYGTGFVGGYFKPIEIFVSLISGSPEQITIEEYGRKRTFTPRSWTLWEPLLTNGDLIVRRNNQRLWIQNVTVRRWKHFVTHQDFETAEVERNHPVYKLNP
jgi:hypothetical protein